MWVPLVGFCTRFSVFRLFLKKSNTRKWVAMWILADVLEIPMPSPRDSHAILTRIPCHSHENPMVLTDTFTFAWTQLEYRIALQAVSARNSLQTWWICVVLWDGRFYGYLKMPMFDIVFPPRPSTYFAWLKNRKIDLEWLTATTPICLCIYLLPTGY